MCTDKRFHCVCVFLGSSHIGKTMSGLGDGQKRNSGAGFFDLVAHVTRDKIVCLSVYQENGNLRVADSFCSTAFLQIKMSEQPGA